MQRYVSLLFFLLLVLGGGLMIGYATLPGDSAWLFLPYAAWVTLATLRLSR